MTSSDNDRKKVWKFFSPWQYEQEQAWLEEQARQGWLLEKGAFVYQFMKCPSQEVVYRIDYISITNPKKLDTYKAAFEESGWDYLFSYFGWHYFRIPAEQYTIDIYSDTPSKIVQLKRMNQDALTIFLVYLLLLISLLDIESWFGIGMVLLNIGVMAMGVTWYWKTHEKIKSLNLTLDEDERIKPEL